MMISVKLYAHLRELIDKRAKLDFELESGATVGQLIDELVQDSKIREHLLDKNNDLRSNITILRNGREIKFLDGLNTVLHPMDEISIFPVVAGG